MRSSLRIALVWSMLLPCSPLGCRRDPTPEAVGSATAPASPQPVERVERRPTTTYQGRWEGTVGSMHLRSQTDRASLQALDEQTGLCSFGIGCRVPHMLGDLGPDGGTITGNPRMCVLELRTDDGQEYALLFAEPPDATITVTADDLAIELRGVEDDTGQAVTLRYAGRPPA